MKEAVQGGGPFCQEPWLCLERAGEVVAQDPAPCSLTGSFPLQEKDTSLYRPALEELRRQIRSSTTSMTSVPKPLKFLRPHYGKLKEIYENMAPGENKVETLGPTIPCDSGGSAGAGNCRNPLNPGI